MHNTSGLRISKSCLHRQRIEFVQGLLAALVGIVSDPYTGFKQGNVPGLLLGSAKGVVGLGLRPMGGFSEFCSKTSQGLALVCLGRQGIQGRAMRRVYAPGTTRRMHDQQVPSLTPIPTACKYCS
jgi:hypothetical protein